MTARLRERYVALLAAYASDPREDTLLHAAEVGRELVLRDVPPEEVVEFHEAALERLGERMPSVTMKEAARLVSQPLAEVLVAYGLAYRDRVEGLRRAEEEIRSSERFLSTVLDTAAALIVVLDPEGRIVRFNRACEEATGYRAEEVLGRAVWDLFLVPEEVEGVRAVFDELRAGAFPSRHENQWVARDGSRRLISWSNAAVLGEGGEVRYVIGTGLDQSKQRLMEAQVHHQERLAAAGQLASGIAHEIGNPLAAISGILEVLQMRNREPDLLRRLQVVSQQVDRIGAILRQMLDLSRPPRMDRVSCDLNATVQTAIGLLRYDKRGGRTELDLHLAPTLPLVPVIEDQMLQVFVNIGLNALDAMQATTSMRRPVLRVSTRVVEGAGGRAVAVAFRDNGPGIPDELASRIFEPFVTTKGPGRGTGLGLAVSDRIVREHGGHIRIENRPGEGASFTVEIPIR